MSFADLLVSPGVRERLVLDGRFGFLAFHGGLEAGTAEAATAAAEAAGASLYTVVQPPELRWHIPSHRVDPLASPALAGFLDHVDVAVALHGYGRPGRPNDILVGGRNRRLGLQLSGHLRAHLHGVAVVEELEDIPPEMRGLHPDNPANRPAGGGVQLELPPVVRGTAPGRAGRPGVPVPGLIEALVATATAWSPEGSALTSAGGPERPDATAVSAGVLGCRAAKWEHGGTK